MDGGRLLLEYCGFARPAPAAPAAPPTIQITGY
jgi:hypothetical protein